MSARHKIWPGMSMNVNSLRRGNRGTTGKFPWPASTSKTGSARSTSMNMFPEHCSRLTVVSAGNGPKKIDSSIQSLPAAVSLGDDMVTSFTRFNGHGDTTSRASAERHGTMTFGLLIMRVVRAMKAMENVAAIFS
ncbi:hypothetical protein CC2G_009968 [Coprinopsis cinerea AmutBmut pab1-1]|nr:hypothetical protein CC2G_009968 [Coprinopsis cinerea AmutBmut pab1-1]